MFRREINITQDHVLHRHRSLARWSHRQLHLRQSKTSNHHTFDRDRDYGYRIYGRNRVFLYLGDGGRRDNHLDRQQVRNDLIYIPNARNGDKLGSQRALESPVLRSGECMSFRSTPQAILRTTNPIRPTWKYRKQSQRKQRRDAVIPLGGREIIVGYVDEGCGNSKAKKNTNNAGKHGRDGTNPES